MTSNDLIGTTKAAQILGVSKNTILRWIEVGYLEGVRLGIGKGIWKVKESDCLALLLFKGAGSEHATESKNA